MKAPALQTLHVYSTLKQRGNELFHVVSTWNTRGVFVRSMFQEILFEPHSNILKAAKRLCICNQCKESYGSCNLFELYQLNVDLLKETTLRSNIERDAITSVGSYVNDFLHVNSICAIAADNTSYETVWIVKIIEEATVDKEIREDYGVTVIEGETIVEGYFLEKSSQTKTG